MPRRAADGKRPRSSIPAAAFLDRQPSPGPGLQDELALAAPAGWDYKYTVVWRSNARPRLRPSKEIPMDHAELTLRDQAQPRQISLDEYWMPFTPNRDFKADPKMVVRAEGMYYWNDRGEKLIDASSGMFCVNAGHGRKEIADAVHRQLFELDFIAPFLRGHPKQFELAARVAELTPGDLNRIFFVNSGSEAVDTAMKVALAYHQARGQGGRNMFISRERAYHGVNFGGVSLSGIINNRRKFGPTLPGIAHMRHTHLKENFFVPGQGTHGAELAEDLVRFVNLYGAENIAACFVEPIAGSTGVLVPPQGYLQRLREICDAHGILLVFDEVICGFGRTGSPFAAQEFGVTPDMITLAKGLTNGSVPMGAVLVSDRVYDTFMQGPEGIELFHGYTYSAHPVACAAGLATLGIYQREGLLTRAKSLAAHWEEAAHALRGAPHVIDVRNYGLILGVELEPIPGKPGTLDFDVFVKCFDDSVLVRQSGDVVALSPPLIVEPSQIDQM